MGKCSKFFQYKLPPGSVSQLLQGIGHIRTDRVTSDDCSRPGVEKTLPCRIIMSAALEYDKDVHIRKFCPYPRIVPRDFIRGIKEDLHNTIPTQETSPDPRALINNHLIQVIEEPNQYDGPPNFNIKDVQDKIPIQETSPDPRAVIYSYYPIQEEPNRYDGPPNFLFFWRNIKDKFSKIRDYIRMLKKAFMTIFRGCTDRAGEQLSFPIQETDPEEDRKINTSMRFIPDCAKMWFHILSRKIHK